MNNPTATSEWTVETIALLQAHGGIDAIVSAHNAALTAERDRPDGQLEPPWEVIARLREQLATERKKHESCVAWEDHNETLDELQKCREQLAAEREKAAAQDLMAEVRQWHSDPESNEYNDCDHNQCQWCESSLKLGTDCMDAHVRQKTWELQQQLAVAEEALKLAKRELHCVGSVVEKDIDAVLKKIGGAK